MLKPVTDATEGSGGSQIVRWYEESPIVLERTTGAYKEIT